MNIIEKYGAEIDDLIFQLDRAEYEYGVVSARTTPPAERLKALIKTVVGSEPQRHKDKKRELKEANEKLRQESARLYSENSVLRKQLAALDPSTGEAMQKVVAIIEGWQIERGNRARVMVIAPATPSASENGGDHVV